MAALLLTFVAGGSTSRAAADTIPLPCLSILSPPAISVPGQPIRVRLQWGLADPAEPDPTPTTDLTAALLQWGPMARSDSEVIWEGDLIPLCSGTLAGQITCAANLPLLPADLPRATVPPVPPRYLANLYSPCRSRRIAPSVVLPPIAVEPWPQTPPDMPPFSGLMGVWSAALTAERQPVSMHEPLAIDLCLQGRGSATLFQAPTLSHPDLDVSKPTVEWGPTKDIIHVRWTVIPTRVPLEPLHLGFSTLEQWRYSAHHLTLALNVLPDPPPRAGAPVPPPVLLRFHAMPAAPGAGGSALAAGLCAGLGAIAGLILAGAARHRDAQQGPAGRRRAALRRLRQTPITQADELPRVHGDLQVWLRLPSGATAAEIEAALRPRHPELADELRSLESCRFSTAAATANPRRLQGLLRRLSCLVALAVLGLLAPAALPPEDALPQVAAEAFRQRDFGQACNTLNRLRQAGRESPELLLNLGNAYWFTGRRIEALALYERAVRYSPRRQDSRDGLAWLRAQLPSQDAAAAATAWTHPIRDRLRPDEWVFLAGLLIGLSSLVGGLLRWCRRPTWPALASGAVTAGVCLWFAAAQYTGTYRVGATARLTQAIPLRAAPAAVAEELTPVLPPGTVVTPTATVADWVRVRTATAEGWVPETGCILVW